MATLPNGTHGNGINGNGLSLTLNGWGRFLGFVGVPGAIAVYLVWWLTQALGVRLDRMIQLLEAIARAVNAPIS